jgi:hypothetical protein
MNTKKGFRFREVAFFQQGRPNPIETTTDSLHLGQEQSRLYGEMQSRQLCRNEYGKTNIGRFLFRKNADVLKTADPKCQL